MELSVLPEITANLPANINPFDYLMQLQGEVYRASANRRTQRITLGAHTYFIKQHVGVGWWEIIKNLLTGRLPVCSAIPERDALYHLQQLQIPSLSVVGFGRRGWNPAGLESFIMTRELTGMISLEDYCKSFSVAPPSFAVKCALIKAVARITRRMHESGMNHRDYYLCHLWLTNATKNTTNPELYVIDLHRAQLRVKIPERWCIKDLAGLYFSSKAANLTQRDYLRFIREYRATPSKDVLASESAFWKKVKQRGDQLRKRHGE